LQASQYQIPDLKESASTAGLNRQIPLPWQQSVLLQLLMQQHQGGKLLL
jgi:hypothetical protein